MGNQTIKLAEKTFLALLNPYRSVEKTFCLALRNITDEDSAYYIGIKDRVQIPAALLSLLKQHDFHLHTLDAQSLGGRAVDIRLQNPITGKCMTGSSSGTAINVFTGINDLGIGTDGGGSVLAPALSLNLYGFISPLICREHVSSFAQGKSTDGLTFQTSIGFMTRSPDLLERVLHIVFDLKYAIKSEISVLSEEELDFIACDTKKFPSFSATRPQQLDFLKQYLEQYDVIIAKEGPIDVNGFGDTVFGHFDETTKLIQANACKGLIKVANMAGASAMVIPNEQLACGHVLITKSNEESIQKLLNVVKRFPVYSDELASLYFRDLKKYVAMGYGCTE